MKDPSQRLGRAGLRVKLLVGCMTPLIAAVACQAFYTVNAQRAAMLGGLEEKARSLCELMVNVVGPSLALDDPHGVQEGLGYIQKDSDFSFSAVLTSSGGVVAYQGPQGKRADLLATLSLVTEPRLTATHDVLVALYPLKPGTTELGTVAIGLQTASARAAVRRMVLRVVAIATAGILVALAVVLLLASTILRRNRDLKLIMDNVGQGFLSVKRSGELLPEHSAILGTWFGPWKSGEPLWRYLGGVAPQLASWFELLWENVTSDFLPTDVALDQLPSRAQIGSSTFEFLYRPICRGSQLTHVLIVISDVTSAIERERAAIEQRELVSLFQWLLKDRQGLLEFFADSNRMMERICLPNVPDIVTLKREIHTLKGNCGLFNLSSVVAVCQQIESQIEQGIDVLTDEYRSKLLTTWHDVESRLRQLLVDAKSTGRLEIDTAEHQALLAAIGENLPHPALFEMVFVWTAEPIRQRLDRIGQQASALARRLNKGDITIKVDGGGIRLPGGVLAPFWSNVSHLVRNAIDHGLETPEERTAVGKSLAGAISLSAAVRAGHLVIEIEDDGRGIAWNKISDRARSVGLAAETQADLIDALFYDGITTRDQVNELSGRGVGMSALRAACAETGGVIGVWSEVGKGTRFEFSWPAASLLKGQQPRPATSSTTVNEETFAYSLASPVEAA